MAANNAKTGKKVIRRRREKKNVERGQVHIRSSFNNTMVTGSPVSRRSRFSLRAPARVVKLRFAPCRLSAWRSR